MHRLNTKTGNVLGSPAARPRQVSKSDHGGGNFGLTTVNRRFLVGQKTKPGRKKSTVLQYSAVRR
jgi:hypothetical protein